MKEPTPHTETASELLKRIRAERRRRWEETELAKMQAKGRSPKSDAWKMKYKEPEPADTTGLPELPEGWAWGLLSDCGEVSRGKSKHRPRNDPRLFGGPYPFIQTGEVAKSNGLIKKATTFYSDFGLEQSRLFPAGTVCITIAANIADSAVLGIDSCFPDSVVGVTCDESLFTPQLLEYYIRTVRGGLSAFAPATAQKNINLAILHQLAVPMIPLEEQQRIMAKIETLQERSNRARSALTAMSPLLEKFRQSVLAAAFRGDLTREWRQKNPHTEPASELLTRIRTERRRRWEEAELAKLRAKGKEPKGDAWKKKYKEPDPVDSSDLPKLPEGWVWSDIEEIAFVDGGLTKNKSKRANPSQIVPLITVAAVRLRKIKKEGIGEIGLLPEDGDKAELKKDDLLVVEGNGSLEHIGRVALWDGSIPNARHQNHLIRVRPVTVPPHYLLEWMASPRGRNLLINEATSAAGLYNLSLSKVGRIAVPIPPMEEQKEIARRIQEMWDIFPGVETSFHEGLRRLGELTQSILAKAFRGELVPQDPNDEPASDLLARIRAEREKAPPKRRTRRKRQQSS